MATAFTAESGDLARRPPNTANDAAVPTMQCGEYSIDAALVLNDTIQIAHLPAFHVPVDCILTAPELDSGTAIVLDVYVDDTVDVPLITGSTVGQAGGVARMDQEGAAVMAPVATRLPVIVKVATGPTTGETSGTITLTVFSRPKGRDDY